MSHLNSLSLSLFSNPDLVPTRNGYGEGLLELGASNQDIVVLTGDLAESTRVLEFARKYPDRFIECGVAEQNMMGIASGLAAGGKIPFVSSYAVFSPGRSWDQTRVAVALSNLNVKIAGAHTGVSVGPDGATHQALEDMAIMRVLPNMTVLAPCDYLETKKATISSASYPGPVYMRFAREKTPVITDRDTRFEIGKAEVFWDSEETSFEKITKSEIRRSRQILNSKSEIKNEVAVVACGPLVYQAMVAARELHEEGIGTRVINNHTIKPIDKAEILKAARDCGAVVTVEEHQIIGGLGSAVCEVLAQNYPVPMEFVGMNDKFGESGEMDELLGKYKMSVVGIKEAVRRVRQRRQK